MKMKRPLKSSPLIWPRWCGRRRSSAHPLQAHRYHRHDLKWGNLPNFRNKQYFACHNEPTTPAFLTLSLIKNINLSSYTFNFTQMPLHYFIKVTFLRRKRSSVWRLVDIFIAYKSLLWNFLNSSKILQLVLQVLS